MSKNIINRAYSRIIHNKVFKEFKLKFKKNLLKAKVVNAMKNLIKRIYLVNSMKTHFRFMFQIVKKNLKIKSKLTNLPSLLKEFKSEIVVTATRRTPPVNFARRSIMGSACHRLRRSTIGGRVTTVPHRSIPFHHRVI